MHQVYVSIGSNIDRETNIRGALRSLRDAFSGLVVSPVYECPAYGFDGDDFYNLVAGFASEQSDIDELLACLKRLERQFGREPHTKSHASRTLDIDLLLYDDLCLPEHGIPREDILKYYFVLKPLSDIAPDLRHPRTGQTMRETQRRFRGEKLPLTVVDLPLP